ncbi:hypothetical protein [Arsukibacterium sp.]|uniref:hypothetical protein n=1 Tax=Arsukibacterium sp. TaxID=1977258 RepID=UPI002FD9411A
MKPLIIKKMASLLLLSLLAGCATTPIHTTKIDRNAPLTTGHGVVAVQVVNNTSRLSNHHKNWTEVIAVRLDNMEQLKNAALEAARLKAQAEKKRFDPDKVDWSPDMYTLSPSTEGVVSSQLFVGSMPDGEYIISVLHAFYSDGNMSSWINMPVRRAAGTFKVEQGRLSNLGTLIFQPLLNVRSESFWSIAASQRAFVTRLPEEDLQRFVIEKYPNLQPGLNLDMELSWQEDAFQSLRQTLAEQARQNAWGDISLPLAHQGQGAMMSRFGILHFQDKAGNWQEFNLPTNAQLTSVVDASEWIAVGAERGQLFVAASPSDDWQRYNPVSSAEAIVWLRQGRDSYYAMTQSSAAYTLYSFSQPTENWQKIGQVTRRPASFLRAAGGVFATIDQAGQLQVFNDIELHSYQPDSRTWQQQKSQAFVNLSQQRDGTLLGLAVSQWDGIGDQLISTDFGMSWTPLKRSLGFFGDRSVEASLPAKLADGRLVTVSRERVQAQASSNLHLNVSQGDDVNVKSNWKTMGQVPDGCTSLLPELTLQHTVYMLCHEGDVVRTADLGKTWEKIIDIDIPALQQSYDALLQALQE